MAASPERQMTRALPELHAAFLRHVRDAVEGDPRLHALLAGGSYLHGGFDEHSDLDLIVVVEEQAYADVMASRTGFAERLGDLVSAFTGEHVGEPRLLICLYGPPLLHVDLKFVTAPDLHRLIERPAILFSRDRPGTEARLADALVAWPDMTPEWFEGRAWVWLHYAATKLARGELFEAIGMLSFFRDQVLGPMLHRRAGRPQRGVRRVEALGLDPTGRLAATVPCHETASVRDAIVAAVHGYLDLRGDAPPQRAAPAMPSALLNLLDAAAPSDE